MNKSSKSLAVKWERTLYYFYHKPKKVYRAVRTYIEEYNNIRTHQALDCEIPASIYYGLISSAEAI
jgi:putative transposase